MITAAKILPNIHLKTLTSILLKYCFLKNDTIKKNKPTTDINKRAAQIPRLLVLILY